MTRALLFAAMVILTFTFGTLTAMLLPIVTAIFALLSTLAIIRILGHVLTVPTVAPTLATMIGLGVGIDYALFIVTRFREAYTRLGNTDQAVLEAMDTSGRAILLAGTTVVIAPGWVRTDLGGPDAPLSVAQSIPRVVDVIASRAGKRGLLFLNYRGKTVPW